MHRVKKLIKKILGVNEVAVEAAGTAAEPPLFGAPRTMVDVMFINGCDPSVPHPPRYRVSHQREQLEANNISTDEVFYADVTRNDVKYANAFVIFRCPYIDEIGEFISLAKRLNKPVYFDIDDLIIDTCYTNLNKYVQQLSPQEKEQYDEGVVRMGKTLSLCDGAITTTQALAGELAKYVPEVFINRNVASDRMYQLSLEALKLKEDNKNRDVVLDETQNMIVPSREKNEIRVGYFSGSITHNDDVEFILPSLIKILKKHPNVKLFLVGELDIPAELEEFRNQIIIFPFLDWEKLPLLISMVDINLAPLKDNLFNAAKSENKWVEAALVKVVTVASDVGAFHETIQHGITGFLCKEGEWEETLENIIFDSQLRNRVAENAYGYMKKNYITIYTGRPLAQFFRNKLDKTTVLVLPSTEISGGIMVALKHLTYIKKKDYNVTVLAENPSKEWIEFSDEVFPVVSWRHDTVKAAFQKGIATMWTTTEFVESHPKLQERYYLVQGFETDLYDASSPFRGMAHSTYSLGREITYLTVSPWCRRWLMEDFGKEAVYVPNGIVLDHFPVAERNFDGKIRILIEGDSAVSYKGVDESFRITNMLDRDKYEIWYMSYNGLAKDWYHVDKVLHRIPYDEVGKIYGMCHILLKSSYLESFSYPPLEMMATRGYVVALPNDGNSEYLENNINCLQYERGNIEQAKACIEELVHNQELRKRLDANMRLTVEKRDWESIQSRILEVYKIQ